ncbi:MAG: tetratricopeptide repeat protein [Candidatus Promineifilaceae bacterium]
MGRIALRDYLKQIVDLIDESRLDEAVAHCRNILEQHPRHVETYQLFGRALLELQNYGDATDIFQRVLSADPENIISHAGLAVAHSEGDDLPRAIWHMERAFDIDPYNRAILVELSELYARRDGEAPNQIDVTRTALARLYLRGSLYRLAADEFSALLSENPARIDLQLMLAETLYLDQKPKNAARLALKIVDILPLCIKANAILAGVWFASGRPDQAQQHLMRVRSLTLPQMADLNEDTLVAQVLSKIDQKQIPRQVLIEEIDFVPVAGAGYSDESDWSSRTEGEAADPKEMPDWLREFSQSLDDNRRKETGSVESPSNLDRQDSFTGGPTDDPLDPDGGVNSFGPKNLLPADDATLHGSIVDEPWMDAPHRDGGETHSQTILNLPGQADIPGEYRQAKTMMAAALVAGNGRFQGAHGDALVQEDEFPALLHEDAMISNYPIEEDDPMPSGDNMAFPDDIEDEIPRESTPSEWPDEISEDPSDAIDPPDWLYDAVGLSSQSEKNASGDEADIVDDITREGGDTAELSAGAVLPDWLSDIVNIDEERPIASDETGFSEGTIDLETSVAASSDDEDVSTSDIGTKNYYIEKDFADQQGGAKKSTEDAMNGALEDPGNSQDDERDDLDGELKWLEELAASQTASDDTFLGAGSNLDSLGGLRDEDFIPDWLKADILDEASNREPASAYVSEDDKVEVPALGQEGKTIPSQEVPDWLSEQMVNETLSLEEDKSADIDWFNQIIAGDESAIDELLEIQTSSLIAEIDSPTTETIEDQPSWLLELEKLDAAADDIPALEPVQEEVFASSSIESETMDWQPIESTEAVDEIDSLTAEDVPSDPEEAMAWLEQIALAQGLTGEELTEEVSDLVPDEFMEAAFDLEMVGATEEGGGLATEVPDDPDEAMDWLERLAAEQGASEDELMTFVFDADTKVVDEPAVGEGDEELESALADVQMPTDQGEALFWLEELAIGVGIEPEVDDTSDNGFDTHMEEPVIEIEPEDAQIEEEVSIDLEAAHIAAMMSEAVDVLEEEFEFGAELELIDESGGDILTASDIDHVEEDEPHVVDTVEVEPEEEADEEDDDLAWLDSLDEANVTGWLRAEEALLAEEQAPAADLTPSQIDIIPDPEIEAYDEPAIPDQVFEERQFDDHGIPDLSVAQSALQSGHLTEALSAYSALVDSGESLPYVIADLEGAVETYRDQPGFMKLLGDAYSRNGQLQKAIEIYRLALNNL